MSRTVRGLAVLAMGLGLGASPTGAQPPEIPAEALARIEWTVFVGGGGTSRRRVIDSERPGAIDLGEGSAWLCGYGRPRRAAISSTAWSAQRVLGCQRGEATVSATASCIVREDSVDERAATLSLGTTGEPRYVTVTLSCRQRRQR
ncbi:MAG: hypothetical protein ACFCGT_14660 [Sandaracinaceae bacterium]